MKRVLRGVLGGALLLMTLGGMVMPSRAQTITKPETSPRPLGLPFNTEPGPGTWLVGQQYGNTSGAYNFGKYWYLAGQGLHFGIDFSAPCQTPVVAMADGVVDFVDNFSHGSLPHNLAIVHRDLGIVAFYGHLYRRAPVQRGQPVHKGDVVAFSGDPEGTCTSRPHLHLEIRSLNYAMAYNPVNYIEADWAALSLMGYQGRFTKDLYHPNRWQTMEDQPDVRFSDKIVNLYRAAWPPKQKIAPPLQTRDGFEAPVLRDETLAFRQLTQPGCCSMAWWAPASDAVRYFDGPDNEFAQTYEVTLENKTARTIDGLTPASTAFNGSYVLRWVGDQVQITRVTDGKVWQVATSGTWPAFSPSGEKLLWQRFPADPIPGNAPPQTEIWVSNVDGSDRRVVTTQSGGSVHWIDDNRLLLARKEGETLFTAMSIFDLRDKSVTPLFRAENVRGISVAPGGRWVTYYLAFQKDATGNGQYLVETTKEAKPVKLPFFGSVRWRGAGTLLVIPYQMADSMVLNEYDLASGKLRPLTDPARQPFRVQNDEWSVAPDGSKVLYWDAGDNALWVISLPV